ncbi:MAG: PQQ-dependent sugar dehydrogenase [Acidimicrobiia bacterium]
MAISGLNNPWDLAFTPDGEMLVTQRTGEIGVKNGHTVDVLRHLNDVKVGGEGGLMGIAVDPEFEENRRIYVCLSSTRGDTPTGFGGDNRVARFKVNSGFTRLTHRADIVTRIPYHFWVHNGCRLRFGPDLHLWITTGDAALCSAPQDPDSLAGKVLRVDTAGAGAAGNPGGAFDDRVYTRGHRNPQGIAFRPSDGQAFSIEHGPNEDDEVNKLVAGANYGWNPSDGEVPCNYDQSVPMTDLAMFPNAVVAVWSSGAPTIAPSGGTFLDGAQWSGYNGALAAAVLKDEHLHLFTLNGDVLVGEDERLARYEARLRSAVQGPNGKLYLTTDAPSGGGEVWKVTPEPS